MIKENKPIALYEVKEIVDALKESDRTKDIQAFIKKFSNLSAEKSKKLKEEIEKMDIIKLKNTDIIKIVDFAPENAIELNKVVTEANLDADETNKILEAIKNLK